MSEYIIDMSNSPYKSTSGLLCADASQLREPIVRCKDCRYGHEAESGMLNCTGPLTTIWDYYNDDFNENLVEPDGFCKWGEIK